MAFRATLHFGGKDFDNLDCSYNLKRGVDSKGRPSSNIYGGQICVHVEYTEDTSILEQMTNQFKPNSGSIYMDAGDDGVLDIYGIRDWVESLPRKNTSIATLANSYKIIGL